MLMGFLFGMNEYYSFQETLLDLSFKANTVGIHTMWTEALNFSSIASHDTCYRLHRNKDQIICK